MTTATIQPVAQAVAQPAAAVDVLEISSAIALLELRGQPAAVLRSTTSVGWKN